ncbi:MAG: aminotransferase class V-fold PLP-dependent enzyme [Candidatus Sericytochromatia bacterium]|nr:aminotransferase class V-fold PLP-dependent enzyme [Candidatus Tanganyikabacteria bacterium]
MAIDHSPATWPVLVVGGDERVALLDGSHARYINLDCGATTPALGPVADAVRDFLPWYASVHRGAGYKSRLATAIYERTRAEVAAFLGADLHDRLVVYGKNATEALNKLAARLPFGPGDVVLCSMMEHHSNLLPWRSRAQVDYIDIDPAGHLDLADLEAKLARYGGRVRLVAVTGGSNVTGAIPPIHRIAAIAHRHGAEVVVDAAQLAPHRPIRMGALSDPEHLDYLVLSAHKMYAPFGVGVLVGPRSLFLQGDPDVVGGGTVKMVTLDEAVWSEPPEKEEAGSPNAVGAVALAAAMRFLSAVGMERVAAHERDITAYALERLRRIPGVRIYGPPDSAADRLGVISFNVAGYHHSLVAAILGWEAGIAVRNGCFCAHPYLLRLLEVGPEDEALVREEIVCGIRSRVPGAVRATFGLFNTRVDVEALARIARGDIAGTYRQDPATGDHHPDIPSEDHAAQYERIVARASRG